MSILREFFVKLGLGVDEQSFAKGELAADAIKEGLEKVVEVAKEVGEAFIENIKQTAEYSEQINQLSSMTGIAVESLQKFTNAAQVHGVDTGEMAMSMRRLSLMMYEAKEGSSEAAEAAQKLGINLNGTLGDALDTIAEKFHGMTNAQQKTALATLALGRASPALISFLSKGKEALEEFAGIPVLTERQTEAGERFQEQQAALSLQTRAFWQQAIAPMMPALTSLLKKLYEWKQANAALIQQGMRSVLEGVVKAVKALVPVVRIVTDVLGMFGKHWKVVGGALLAMFPEIAMAAVSAALSAMLAWAAAAAPFVIIGGILAGLLLVFDDVAQYQDDLKHGGDGMDTAFGRLKKTLADVLASNGPKPWWLGALELLVAFMDKVQALYEILHGESPAEWLLGVKTADSAKVTPINAIQGTEQRARVARYLQRQAELNYKAPSKFSAWAHGVANSILGPPPAMMMPAVPGGVGGSSTNVVMNIDARGMPEHQVRRVVGDALTDAGVVTRADLQHAHGAAPATAGSGL